MNSPTVVRFSPRRCTGVRSTTMSGPGDRAQRSVAQFAHPGNDRAIAKAPYHLGAHRHAAAFADNDAHAVRIAAADRHEVDQRHSTICRLEARFEDQRVLAVAACDARRFALRCDAEAAVLRLAEQRRKAGIRVEARPAKPIDRAVARDERCALAVADQRIVFDASRHQLNSITTLMSPFLCSKASAKRASGTRRVISRESQPRSARARASAAI